MFRIFLSLIALFASLTFATAANVAPADQTAITQTITNQLEAFKANDGPRAYSYAAPIVTTIFPNPEIFMSMVKRGYSPILNNQKYAIGELTTDTLGRPAQHITITATDGKRYEAVYSMEKQNDGTWKIAGVQMVEIPGLDV